MALCAPPPQPLIGSVGSFAVAESRARTHDHQRVGSQEQQQPAVQQLQQQQDRAGGAPKAGRQLRRCQVAHKPDELR